MPIQAVDIRIVSYNRRTKPLRSSSGLQLHHTPSSPQRRCRLTRSPTASPPRRGGFGGVLRSARAVNMDGFTPSPELLELFQAELDRSAGAAAGAPVDLRSDTVTKPTVAMRLAMACAEVGDDVFGDDPTVLTLEAEAAALLQKEAAMFVPSGTMGNLISIMVHCEVRGSEVILGSDSHVHIYEQGGISQVGGVHPRALPNNADGTIDLDAVEAAVRPFDQHFPVSRVLVLENTHNKKGGRVLPQAYVAAAGALCKKHGLKLHIDGARLFNAAEALGLPPAQLLEHADSSSICLSKALGAPAGSIVVGTKEFIAKAKRTRKALGGGMRQVGVLAAAARVALQETPPKLARDHAHAKQLATALNEVEGLTVDMDSCESNLVYISTGDLPAAEVARGVVARGALVLAVGPFTVRACCHHQVTSEGIARAIAAFQETVAELRP